MVELYEMVRYHNVVRHPEGSDDPDEIVYEIDQTQYFGLALAYIRKSPPHVHPEMWELYQVVNDAGCEVWVEDLVFLLQRGDSLLLPPGHAHQAFQVGGVKPAVFVWTTPPFSPDQYITL